jgi:hypothetical protein
MRVDAHALEQAREAQAMRTARNPKLTSQNR